MKAEIDLTTLSDEQLQLLSLIHPQAAKEERDRRFAYSTFQEAGEALHKTALELELFLANTKMTAATRAVKDSNAVEVITRTLALLKKETEYDGS